MHKNIRRSIVIAAGVTGAWALGSAVASADELPATSASVPDASLSVDDVDDVVGTVTDTTTDTLTDVTGGTAVKAQNTVADTTAKAKPTVDAKTKAADQARRYVEADLPAQQVARAESVAHRAPTAPAAETLRTATPNATPNTTAEATATATDALNDATAPPPPPPPPPGGGEPMGPPPPGATAR
ncbi:hypothetical protein ACFWXN_42560, partial [Streptomyces sp. NPDC058694]